MFNKHIEQVKTIEQELLFISVILEVVLSISYLFAIPALKIQSEAGNREIIITICFTHGVFYIAFGLVYLINKLERCKK